ncbi:Uncharacterised protein [Vibrio cholerae]|nr:Uncharacterised protein [Vibrio cholerae]
MCPLLSLTLYIKRKKSSASKGCKLTSLNPLPT